MAKKLTDPDKLTPKVRGYVGVGMHVELPKLVRNDPDVMRWLHHWIGDTMADRGYLKLLVSDVQNRLGTLTRVFACDYVKDLLRQARAATSQPKESQAPKNGAKRKRK